MTDSDFQEYIDEDFAKYLAFYDKRSVSSKFWLHFYSVYILIVSLLITPLLAIDMLSSYDGRFWAAILAPSIALAAGLKEHFQFHKNWLSYRSTWEALRTELNYKKAGVSSYGSADDSNSLFVERVEAIRQAEGSDWLTRFSRDTKHDDDGSS